MIFSFSRLPHPLLGEPMAAGALVHGHANSLDQRARDFETVDQLGRVPMFDPQQFLASAS
jgi:hypothetical protein